MNQNGTVKKNDASMQALQDLRAKLEEIVDDPELWWQTPHELLGWYRPDELASQGPKGKEFVEGLIGRIRNGIFS